MREGRRTDEVDDEGLDITEDGFGDDGGLEITEGDFVVERRPHISRWLWVLTALVLVAMVAAAIGIVSQHTEPRGLVTNLSGLNRQTVALTEEIATLNTTLATINNRSTQPASTITVIRPQLQQLPSKLAAISSGLTQVTLQVRSVDTSTLKTATHTLDLLRAALNVQLAQVANIIAVQAADVTAAITALNTKVAALTKQYRAAKKASTKSQTRLDKQIHAANHEIHQLRAAAKTDRRATAKQLANLRQQLAFLQQFVTGTGTATTPPSTG